MARTPSHSGQYSRRGLNAGRSSHRCLIAQRASVTVVLTICDPCRGAGLVGWLPSTEEAWGVHGSQRSREGCRRATCRNSSVDWFARTSPGVGADLHRDTVAWRPDPLYEILLIEADRCDIPRVHVKNSSAEALSGCQTPDGNCLDLGIDWDKRPWLFVGLTENSRLREISGPCGRARMLQKFGNREVILSSMVSFSHGRKAKSFAEYVAEDMLPPPFVTALEDGLNASSSWYLCGDNFWDEILDEYDRPRILGGDLAALSFGIGRTGSGVQ